jgi:hypothetical protein
MTLKEFNSLPLLTRSDLIYEWGYFISSHKSDGVNRVLYAINGYFAEETISLHNETVIDIKAYDGKFLSRHDLENIRTNRSFLLMAPGVLHDVTS